VFLKLRSGVQEKGRGFCKINNSILQELEYQTLINHLIDKQDIIDYADIYKIEGSLVFIDFKKAFDLLEWDFMLLTLKRFGFNDSFVNWVKTMYTDI
jgi:phosphoribosylaminoimidazole-succinocarboxamide synthase